ncbi:translation initiation factor IF-2-like [Lemur catta]|uniref:translation initiation factor IF-2-like n=1 Tax=Lemur catta TaxID=9447 RepID=UPI001E2691C1|nr:translation initiation factor IF-2-like [Lemur catta]
MAEWGRFTGKFPKASFIQRMMVEGGHCAGPWGTSPIWPCPLPSVPSVHLGEQRGLPSWAAHASTAPPLQLLSPPKHCMEQLPTYLASHCLGHFFTSRFSNAPQSGHGHLATSAPQPAAPCPRRVTARVPVYTGTGRACEPGSPSWPSGLRSAADGAANTAEQAGADPAPGRPAGCGGAKAGPARCGRRPCGCSPGRRPPRPGRDRGPWLGGSDLLPGRSSGPFPCPFSPPPPPGPRRPGPPRTRSGLVPLCSSCSEAVASQVPGDCVGGLAGRRSAAGPRGRPGRPSGAHGGARAREPGNGRGLTPVASRSRPRTPGPGARTALRGGQTPSCYAAVWVSLRPSRASRGGDSDVAVPKSELRGTLSSPAPPRQSRAGWRGSRLRWLRGMRHCRGSWPFLDVPGWGQAVGTGVSPRCKTTSPGLLSPAPSPPKAERHLLAGEPGEVSCRVFLMTV